MPTEKPPTDEAMPPKLYGVEEQPQTETPTPVVQEDPETIPARSFLREQRAMIPVNEDIAPPYRPAPRPEPYPHPWYKQLHGAAVMSNIPASALTSFYYQGDTSPLGYRSPDDYINPFKVIEGTEYEPFWREFVGITTSEGFMNKVDYLDRMVEINEAAAQSLGTTLVGIATGSMTDPLNWMFPLAFPVRGISPAVKFSRALTHAKGGASLMGTGALAASAQEVPLGMLNPLYEHEWALYAASGGAIFNLFMGTGLKFGHMAWNLKKRTPEGGGPLPPQSGLYPGSRPPPGGPTPSGPYSGRYSEGPYSPNRWSTESVYPDVPDDAPTTGRPPEISEWTATTPPSPQGRANIAELRRRRDELHSLIQWKIENDPPLFPGGVEGVRPLQVVPNQEVPQWWTEERVAQRLRGGPLPKDTPATSPSETMMRIRRNLSRNAEFQSAAYQLSSEERAAHFARGEDEPSLEGTLDKELLGVVYPSIPDLYRAISDIESRLFEELYGFEPIIVGDPNSGAFTEETPFEELISVLKVIPRALQFRYRRGPFNHPNPIESYRYIDKTTKRWKQKILPVWAHHFTKGVMFHSGVLGPYIMQTTPEALHGIDSAIKLILKEAEVLPPEIRRDLEPLILEMRGSTELGPLIVTLNHLEDRIRIHASRIQGQPSASDVAAFTAERNEVNEALELRRRIRDIDVVGGQQALSRATSEALDEIAESQNAPAIAADPLPALGPGEPRAQEPSAIDRRFDEAWDAHVREENLNHYTGYLEAVLGGGTSDPVASNAWALGERIFTLLAVPRTLHLRDSPIHDLINPDLYETQEATAALVFRQIGAGDNAPVLGPPVVAPPEVAEEFVMALAREWGEEPIPQHYLQEQREILAQYFEDESQLIGEVTVLPSPEVPEFPNALLNLRQEIEAIRDAIFSDVSEGLLPNHWAVLADARLAGVNRWMGELANLWGQTMHRRNLDAIDAEIAASANRYNEIAEQVARARMLEPSEAEARRMADTTVQIAVDPTTDLTTPLAISRVDDPDRLTELAAQDAIQFTEGHGEVESAMEGWGEDELIPSGVSDDGVQRITGVENAADVLARLDQELELNDEIMKRRAFEEMYEREMEAWDQLDAPPESALQPMIFLPPEIPLPMRNRWFAIRNQHETNMRLTRSPWAWPAQQMGRELAAVLETQGVVPTRDGLSQAIEDLADSYILGMPAERVWSHLQEIVDATYDQHWSNVDWDSVRADLSRQIEESRQQILERIGEDVDREFLIGEMFSGQDIYRAGGQRVRSLSNTEGHGPVFGWLHGKIDANGDLDPNWNVYLDAPPFIGRNPDPEVTHLSIPIAINRRFLQEHLNDTPMGRDLAPELYGDARTGEVITKTIYDLELFEAIDGGRSGRMIHVGHDLTPEIFERIVHHIGPDWDLSVRSADAERPPLTEIQRRVVPGSMTESGLDEIEAIVNPWVRDPEEGREPELWFTPVGSPIRNYAPEILTERDMNTLRLPFERVRGMGQVAGGSGAAMNGVGSPTMDDTILFEKMLRGGGRWFPLGNHERYDGFYNVNTLIKLGRNQDSMDVVGDSELRILGELMADIPTDKAALIRQHWWTRSDLYQNLDEIRDELLAIRGIGPRTWEKISDKLTLEHQYLPDYFETTLANVDGYKKWIAKGALHGNPVLRQIDRTLSPLFAKMLSQMFETSGVLFKSHFRQKQALSVERLVDNYELRMTMPVAQKINLLYDTYIKTARNGMDPDEAAKEALAQSHTVTGQWKQQFGALKEDAKAALNNRGVLTNPYENAANTDLITPTEIRKMAGLAAIFGDSYANAGEKATEAQLAWFRGESEGIPSASSEINQMVHMARIKVFDPMYKMARELGMFQGDEWKGVRDSGRSYFPRFLNYEFIADNQALWVERLSEWKYAHENKLRDPETSDITDIAFDYIEYTMDEATAWALDAYQHAMHSPRGRLVELDPDIIDFVTPKHTRDRVLGGDTLIPDEVIFPFLVLDLEAVVRLYVKNMAPEIELRRLARSYSRTQELDRLADQVIKLRSENRGDGDPLTAVEMREVEASLLNAERDLSLRQHFQKVQKHLKDADAAMAKVKDLEKHVADRAKPLAKALGPDVELAKQLNKVIERNTKNAAHSQKMAAEAAKTLRKRMFELVPELSKIPGWMDSILEMKKGDVPPSAMLAPSQLAARAKLGSIFASETVADPGGIAKIFNDLIYKDYERVRSYRPQEDHSEINRQRDSDIKVMTELLDVMRNMYHDSADVTEMPSRIARRVKKFNVNTYGGSFLLASLPDAGRLVLINGLSDFAGELRSIVTDPAAQRAFQMTAEDAQDFGAAVEMVLNLRGSLYTETARHFEGSTIDRMLTAGTDWMFLLNGLPAWNDSWKRMASALLYMKVMRAGRRLVAKETLSEAELLEFHRIGIDAHDLEQIYKTAQRAAGSEVISDGLPLAPTSKWDDPVSAEVYRNAIVREVNNLIITPTIGDKPLLMNNEVWSAMLQFWTFSFAAMPRLLVQGMQRSDAIALNQLFLMLSLGVLAYVLKSIAHGWELSDDPREWASQGIDRSGMLGVFSKYDGLLSSLTGGEVSYGRLLGNLKPNPQLERNQLPDRTFGASWSRVEAARDLSQALLERNMKPGDINHVKNFMWGQSLFYTDWLTNLAADPMKEWVSDRPGPKPSEPQ